MELVKFLAASEEKFADAEHRIKEFKHNMETLDDLANRVDEAENKLKTAGEHIRFRQSGDQTDKFF